MFYPIDFVNLTLAALIGGAIGFERQWNQGLAGLRTNTLVAFGSASFMALHVEQTAAYIVTGIGFLCAGVIFREGASVRGLNTATTMWCTAAAGGLAGGGFYAMAIFCGAGVVAINLGVTIWNLAIPGGRWSLVGWSRYWLVFGIALPLLIGAFRARVVPAPTTWKSRVMPALDWTCPAAIPRDGRVRRAACTAHAPEETACTR